MSATTKALRAGPPAWLQALPFGAVFLFFFVAFMNCIGLIPSAPPYFSTYTATGTPYVTGALALCTLITMLFFGMRQQGVCGFF